MIPNLEWLRQNKPRILQIAANYQAKNVRVFGSVARGETTWQSDIDLLVDMPNTTGILTRIELKQDLEFLLKCKVDVIRSDSIHPRLKANILHEAIPL
jgi:predicted nucleotidyltransferase